MIRPCELHDIPWLLDLATGAYPPGTFDAIPTERWLSSLIAAHGFESLTARGEHGAGFATIFRPPWKPSELCCDIIHVFGDGHGGMEPVRVVAFLRDQAFERGCAKVYFGSSFDNVGPIARRLGARPLPKAWLME